MKMHRFEEIWLIFAVVIIVGSMVITGYQAFALGMGLQVERKSLIHKKLMKQRHLTIREFSKLETRNMRL